LIKLKQFINNFYQMKNYNYNLIRLLHELSDISWRIDKHCEGDANNLECDCPKIMAKVKANTDENIKLVLDEIKQHQASDDLAA